MSFRSFSSLELLRYVRIVRSLTVMLLSRPGYDRPCPIGAHLLIYCHSVMGYTPQKGEQSMGLTKRQEWLIARYLREVDAALGDVPDVARERVSARVRARIDRGLQHYQSASVLVRDDDVAAVLDAMGSPRRQASECIQKAGLPRGLALSVDRRIWLGVCGGLAQYLNMDPRYVRLAFVLLGVTGPIILLIYLALYFDMYLSVHDAHVPRIDKPRLLRSVASAFLGVLVLYIAARLLMIGVLEIYQRFVATGSIVTLDRWDWLRANGRSMLIYALSITVPLAALSALPLANEWDRTLDRVVKAAVAVYAVVLCFGIALFLVGLVLHAVDTVNF
jgi:phage shock protein PspC (stress-responsive transcriptional regulator)